MSGKIQEGLTAAEPQQRMHPAEQTAPDAAPVPDATTSGRRQR